MHVKSKILLAFQSAVASVPAAGEVSLRLGGLAAANKVRFAEVYDGGGKNKKLSGRSEPKTGVLDRTMHVCVEFNVPASDTSTTDFYDQILAPVETAIALSDELEELADDWFLSDEDTDWPPQYGDRLNQVGVYIWTVNFKTPTAAPGQAY